MGRCDLRRRCRGEREGGGRLGRPHEECDQGEAARGVQRVGEGWCDVPEHEAEETEVKDRAGERHGNDVG